MIYRDSLSPWCVVQQLPKLQHAIVARFRNRNDAEAYIKVIRRINPTVTYEIMFAPPIVSIDHSDFN